MNTQIHAIGSTTALFVALLSFTAVIERAQADSTPATHSVVVQYTKKDLERHESRQALEARIEAAARAACGTVDIRNLALRQAAKECREAAVASAMAQVEAQRSAALRD